ncbi:MAG TPA: hypothetical protein VIG48_09580 [Jatrophihabitans sp.]|jgi:hypothetical protein
MSEMVWVRSHVERLLQDEWSVCRVEADRDGDYPFRNGTAACWVRLIDAGEPLVRVFAHAACGVRRSVKLLTELNDIQNRALTTSVMLTDGCVVIAQTVSAYELSCVVLGQAMAAVGGLADEVGVLLAGMFGGSTPLPAEVPEPEEAE